MPCDLNLKIFLQNKKYNFIFARKMIKRYLSSSIESALSRYPSVAILGPRQVGKTTLAREQLSFAGKVLYLDMERPSDRTRLDDPEYFLSGYADHLIIIDEVQQKMDLFPVLRSLIDAQRTPGRFLLLGSASDLLISQSSESLAGRISYKELHPFSISETGAASLNSLWLRGGYPSSFLSDSDELAFDWLENFVRTYVERELGVSKLRTTPPELARFLRVVASLHGQLVNYSGLAQTMQLSVPTVKQYLQFLEHAYLLRTLEPYHNNPSKRLVKSPKIYVRDSGILHYLRGVDSLFELEGDILKGASWEGFCIQQIISSLKLSVMPFFYRTAAGAELDLVLMKGTVPTIAFEFKYSNSPLVSKGNTEAMKDLGMLPVFVVTPTAPRARVREGVEIIAVRDLPAVLAEHGMSAI